MYHYRVNFYLSAQDDEPSYVVPVTSTHPLSEESLRGYVQTVMQLFQVAFVDFASAYDQQKK